MIAGMKAPQRNPRPWRMFLPLLGLLGLAAAWSVYWYIGLETVRTVAGQERQKLAEGGLTLACAEEGWGGYPFRFEFSCLEADIQSAGRFRLQTARIQAVAQAYNPWHVIVMADGSSRFSLAGRPELAATHGRTLASIRLDGNRMPQISAEIPRLAVENLFAAETVRVHLRPEPEGATGLAASVAKFRFAAPDQPPLDIDSGEFLGTLTRGGTLQIGNLTLKKGAVTYRGAGTAALDAMRRVSGTLNTETNDIQGLLKILEPFFALKPEQLNAMATMLQVLGPGAKADLIARDGELFLGPFKIADLLPIH